MSAVIFNPVTKEFKREACQGTARGANGRADFPCLKPTAPAGDLTSMMTLAAVAAWARSPITTYAYTTCCEGGEQ